MSVISNPTTFKTNNYPNDSIVEKAYNEYKQLRDSQYPGSTTQDFKNIGTEISQLGPINSGSKLAQAINIHQYWVDVDNFNKAYVTKGVFKAHLDYWLDIAKLNIKNPEQLRNRVLIILRNVLSIYMDKRGTEDHYWWNLLSDDAKKKYCNYILRYAASILNGSKSVLIDYTDLPSYNQMVLDPEILNLIEEYRTSTPKITVMEPEDPRRLEPEVKFAIAIAADKSIVEINKSEVKEYGIFIPDPDTTLTRKIALFDAEIVNNLGFGQYLLGAINLARNLKVENTAQAQSIAELQRKNTILTTEMENKINQLSQDETEMIKMKREIDEYVKTTKILNETIKKMTSMDSVIGEITELLKVLIPSIKETPSNKKNIITLRNLVGDIPENPNNIGKIIDLVIQMYVEDEVEVPILKGKIAENQIEIEKIQLELGNLRSKGDENKNQGFLTEAMTKLNIENSMLKTRLDAIIVATNKKEWGEALTFIQQLTTENMVKVTESKHSEKVLLDLENKIKELGKTIELKDLKLQEAVKNNQKLLDYKHELKILKQTRATLSNLQDFESSVTKTINTLFFAWLESPEKSVNFIAKLNEAVFDPKVKMPTGFLSVYNTLLSIITYLSRALDENQDLKRTLAQMEVNFRESVVDSSTKILEKIQSSKESTIIEMNKTIEKMGGSAITAIRELKREVIPILRDLSFNQENLDLSIRSLRTLVQDNMNDLYEQNEFTNESLLTLKAKMEENFMMTDGGILNLRREIEDHKVNIQTLIEEIPNIVETKVVVPNMNKVMIELSDFAKGMENQFLISHQMLKEGQATIVENIRENKFEIEVYQKNVAALIERVWFQTETRLVQLVSDLRAGYQSDLMAFQSTITTTCQAEAAYLIDNMWKISGLIQELNVDSQNQMKMVSDIMMNKINDLSMEMVLLFSSKSSEEINREMGGQMMEEEGYSVEQVSQSIAPINRLKSNANVKDLIDKTRNSLFEQINGKFKSNILGFKTLEPGNCLDLLIKIMEGEAVVPDLRGDPITEIEAAGFGRGMYKAETMQFKNFAEKLSKDLPFTASGPTISKAEWLSFQSRLIKEVDINLLKPQDIDEESSKLINLLSDYNVVYFYIVSTGGTDFDIETCDPLCFYQWLVHTNRTTDQSNNLEDLLQSYFIGEYGNHTNIRILRETKVTSHESAFRKALFGQLWLGMWFLKLNLSKIGRGLTLTGPAQQLSQTIKPELLSLIASIFIAVSQSYPLEWGNPNLYGQAIKTQHFNKTSKTLLEAWVLYSANVAMFVNIYDELVPGTRELRDRIQDFQAVLQSDSLNTATLSLQPIVNNIVNKNSFEIQRKQYAEMAILLDLPQVTLENIDDFFETSHGVPPFITMSLQLLSRFKETTVKLLTQPMIREFLETIGVGEEPGLEGEVNLDNNVKLSVNNIMLINGLMLMRGFMIRQAHQRIIPTSLKISELTLINYEISCNSVLEDPIISESNIGINIKPLLVQLFPNDTSFQAWASSVETMERNPNTLASGIINIGFQPEELDPTNAQINADNQEAAFLTNLYTKLGGEDPKIRDQLPVIEKAIELKKPLSYKYVRKPGVAVEKYIVKQLKSKGVGENVAKNELQKVRAQFKNLGKAKVSSKSVLKEIPQLDALVEEALYEIQGVQGHLKLNDPTRFDRWWDTITETKANMQPRKNVEFKDFANRTQEIFAPISLAY